MNFAEGEIFAIDKPYGITSFKALAHVRYLITHAVGHRVKIGHAGTLDPLATGVLVLCTGRCTKRIEELQTHRKEYLATLQFGATTASYDKEHEVNATFPTSQITRERLEETLRSFEGQIEQVPPTFSAVKVGGKRSYEMRRAGEQVELKPKTISIYGITLEWFDADKMLASIRVECGKGTYIRALARDIGRALDSGAYLTSLRRTRSGDLTTADCIDYDNFQQWLDKQEIERTI